MIRVLALVGALVGGAGMSQFPEFSVQYEQRLGGAVNEMRDVVACFDQSLADVGLTRDLVCAKTEGSALELKLISDAKASVARLTFLEGALARLQGASVMTKLFAIPTVSDMDVARNALNDFKPGIQISVEGLAGAAFGAIVGWFSFSWIFGAIGWVFGRRDEEEA